jgi:hypothetical protein
MAKSKKPDVVVLEREIVRLRSVIQRVIVWLDERAAQAHTEAQQYRGRFGGLADACDADAKNYRATADNLRKNLSS